MAFHKLLFVAFLLFLPLQQSLTQVRKVDDSLYSMSQFLSVCLRSVTFSRPPLLFMYPRNFKCPFFILNKTLPFVSIFLKIYFQAPSMIFSLNAILSISLSNDILLVFGWHMFGIQMASGYRGHIFRHHIRDSPESPINRILDFIFTECKFVKQTQQFK